MRKCKSLSERLWKIGRYRANPAVALTAVIVATTPRNGRMTGSAPNEALRHEMQT